MTLRDVITNDLFTDAPVECCSPHYAAARRAHEAWLRAGARRNHFHYRSMVDHLKCLLGGAGDAGRGRTPR